VLFDPHWLASMYIVFGPPGWLVRRGVALCGVAAGQGGGVCSRGNCTLAGCVHVCVCVCDLCMRVHVATGWTPAQLR
jgi:hypothetical protein